MIPPGHFCLANSALLILYFEINLFSVAWKYVQMNVLPYIIDWFFVLILGILMAALSFIIDYLIEQIRRGELKHH